MRGWAAAYVLGALEPDERARFEAHLASCDRCRAETTELAPLPGLLARVDPDDLDRPPIDVADAAASRARAEVVSLRRSRMRWRVLGTAAAVITIAIATLAAVTWYGGDEEAAATPLDVESALDLEAWAAVTERSWGTEVAVGCDDIPESERYALLAFATDGRSEQAAAWGPSDEYHVVVEGATSIPLEELDHIVVTDARGRELFVGRGRVE